MSLIKTEISTEIPFSEAATAHRFAHMGPSAVVFVASPEIYESKKLAQDLSDIFENCGRDAFFHVVNTRVQAAQKLGHPLSCTLQLSN